MTANTTKHKHPYARLTIAEAHLVDSNEIPASSQVKDAVNAIHSMGLSVYGPGIDESDPFFSGSQDYDFVAVAVRLDFMNLARAMLDMGIYPDNINDPYTHQQSGETQSLGDWYDDYQCMDAESWHGNEGEDCHPENWIEDGALKPWVDPEEV